MILRKPPRARARTLFRFNGRALFSTNTIIESNRDRSAELKLTQLHRDTRFFCITLTNSSTCHPVHLFVSLSPLRGFENKAPLALCLSGGCPKGPPEDEVSQLSPIGLQMQVCLPSPPPAALSHLNRRCSRSRLNGGSVGKPRVCPAILAERGEDVLFSTEGTRRASLIKAKVARTARRAAGISSSPSPLSPGEKIFAENLTLLIRRCRGAGLPLLCILCICEGASGRVSATTYVRGDDFSLSWRD